jgi:uncharacterized protein (DUF1800 family)
LHTLGVRTGYTQDDVVSFAKVITGWTTYLPDLPERGGEFLFYPRFHEPGPQTVLGKAYRDTGFEQGKDVLADLARRRCLRRLSSPQSRLGARNAGIVVHFRDRLKYLKSGGG